MSDLSFRADIKLATATLEAIERAVVAGNDDGLRPHLGASVIGRPCDRALWYGFRWSTRHNHPARLLRLFARGQNEEAVFVDLLRKAGITVATHDERTGAQFSFKTGHFGGSMDGACHGLPEAPATWHVIEMKTSSEKLFNTLVKEGVAIAKPEHLAQMQCYMAWTGMQRALYMAVCKNTDRLHLERIDFDRSMAEALFAKAQRIIEASEPPAGISEKPDWYQCKLCDHHSLCHGTAAPLPTCRSCAHVTPVADGQWHCVRNSKLLTVAEQKAACQGHRYIPALLTRWAKVTDANTESNWVHYENTLTGHAFVNGLPPAGVESVEIYAAQDKKAIGHPEVQGFREEFNGRIAA